MPEFGPDLRSEWLLDPAVSYLNHGTVGAPPRRVLAAQAAIRDEIERQPATFLLRELTAHEHAAADPPRLRVAAEAVAPFLGVAGEELVFVDNITTGVNAVLRSLRFAAGEEILVTDLGYGGVTRAAEYAARVGGAAMRTIAMPSIGAPAEEFVDAVVGAVRPQTRLVLVDHITSSSALVLPIGAIVRGCRARGAQVLVDGAHVPGSIPLDIDSIGADWYVANLHKWMWTPRSSGIVWAAPEHRESLHPAVISWGLDQGMTAEFDLVGTRDPTPHLAAPAAVAMLESWGFSDICTYNHELVWWAGQYLADRWGTVFRTPEEMIGTMVTVDLPAALGADQDAARRVQARLLAEHGIEVPVSVGPGGLRTRVSAQVYVGRSEIERLGAAVGALARDGSR